MPLIQDTVATNIQASLNGSVHGGQQPVTGATITLMAPGTSGYGSAPTVLATTTAGKAGAWTLPAYTCPANNGLVYVMATGGNSGAGVNPVLAEAAVLGPCSSLSASTYINITEATTVAAAYALAPFASVTTGQTGIGTSATNLQGLANTFGPANNLVDFQTGLARVPGAVTGLVLPQAVINTLADILASCINSTGSTAATAPCGVLFSATTPASGSAPTDTLQAALNIALNPGRNVSTLYSLLTAAAPFQPALSAAPTDFMVAIQYNGAPIGNSYGTQGIAIDSVGDAWVATGNTLEGGGTTHALTEISPAGVYLSGTAGFGSSALGSPEGIAISASSDVFVTDTLSDKLLHFGPNGSVLNTYTPSPAVLPSGIAVDADTSLWIADGYSRNTSNMVHVVLSGSSLSSTGFYTPGSSGEVVLNNASVWSDQYSPGTLSYYTKNGGGQYFNFFAVPGNGAGVALDNAGDVWFSADSSTGGVVGRVDAANTVSISTFPIPSPLQPQTMFLDGLGHVWATTYNRTKQSTPARLFEFSSSGALLSPISGYDAGNVLPSSPGFPGGVAVDSSGNVWLSGVNSDDNGQPQANAAVIELVGAAAPVRTPIAVAAASNQLASRP